MIKYFCDRCGAEMKRTSALVFPTDSLKTAYLCPSCYYEAEQALDMALVNYHEELLTIEKAFNFKHAAKRIMED